MGTLLASPPRPLFYASVSAALGVWFCDGLSPPLSLCLAFCSAAAVYIVFHPAAVAGFVFIFALAGTAHQWRHNLSPSRGSVDRIEAQHSEAVELRGQVLDVPRSTAKASLQPVPIYQQQGLFHLRVQQALPFDAVQPESKVLVHWRGVLPGCGDTVWLRGALERIPRPRNPGEIDVARFQMRQGVWVQVHVVHPQEARIMERGGWCLQTWAAQTRKDLSAQLLRGIEDRPQIHELIASMVFGIQGNALETTRNWFRDSGTLHLFAVSGLNLSMLAGFLAVVLRLLGAGPRATASVAVPVLALYAVVTGLGPSCIRALLASLLCFGTEWVNRPAVALNSLGGAALLLLLIDGNFLFQLSFQLSFGLVLVLNFAAVPLARWFRQKCEPDPLIPRKWWTAAQQRRVVWGGRGSEALASTLLCWCAGLPWGVCVFHQVAPVSIFTNLVAVPLSFVNLALGFLALLFAPLKGVTPALNRANAGCAEFLLELVHRSSLLPAGHWPVASLGKPQPSLVVFDVGDGGAVLVCAQNSKWLLDCGSENQAGRILLPALQQYGLRALDGLVLSHADSAHVGGTASVFEALSPSVIFKTPFKERSAQVKTLHQRLLSMGAPVAPISANTQLCPPGPLCWEVLYPPSDLRASAADDQCLILRGDTPFWKILYTADAGLPAERWLLEHARPQLSADIWIRGSHGRELTGSEDFVKAVNPKVIIVAGSRFHKNPAPLEAWTQKWREQGVAVWRQEECGAVEGWSGNTNRLRSFLTGCEISWQAESP